MEKLKNKIEVGSKKEREKGKENRKKEKPCQESPIKQASPRKLPFPLRVYVLLRTLPKCSQKKQSPLPVHLLQS
jgi:hypothetical protein